MRRRQHVLGRQRPVDEPDAGRLVALHLARRVQQVEGVRRADEPGQQPRQARTRRRGRAGRTTSSCTASSFMNRRSTPSTIGTPMPATAPLMAATIGLGTDMKYEYVPRRSSPNDGSPGAGASSARATTSGAPRAAAAVGAGRGGEALHVGAGAEALAGAGEDDADDVRVGLGPADGVAHLVGHRLGPGVELLGAVQRDDGDGVVDLEEDVLVRHARIMARIVRGDPHAAGPAASLTRPLAGRRCLPCATGSTSTGLTRDDGRRRAAARAGDRPAAAHRPRRSHVDLRDAGRSDELGDTVALRRSSPSRSPRSCARTRTSCSSGWPTASPRSSSASTASRPSSVTRHQAAPADRRARRDHGRAHPPHAAPTSRCRRALGAPGDRRARLATSATARATCASPSTSSAASSPSRRCSRPTRSAGPTSQGAVPQHGRRRRHAARPVRVRAPLPAHRGRRPAPADRPLGAAHARRRPAVLRRRHDRRRRS